MHRNAKLHSTALWWLSLALLAAVSAMPEYALAREGAVENLLSGAYPYETLEKILVPRANWRPFPSAGEHEAWLSLPEETRKCHIAKGEKALALGVVPQLSATLYLDYIRTGEVGGYKKPYKARRSMLCDMVLAECMEGGEVEGRFMDNILDLVWAICEESSWCTPPHSIMQKDGLGLPDPDEPIVDLRAAETGALLAWTDFLVGEKLDSISLKIRKRIRHELDKRIITPCLERDFHWMGFQTMERRPNNWNPWCNSNVLAVALLMERNRECRLRLVDKVLRSLDKYLGPYPGDGGCDEGPHYWDYGAGKVFDCLELMESATEGRFDVYGRRLISEMGRYIYRAYIDGSYFLSIADTGGKHILSGYLEFRYGRKIEDERLAALGAWAVAGRRGEGDYCVSGNLGRRLQALWSLRELSEAIEKGAAEPPLVRDVWLDDKDLQFMAARCREGSRKGLYLAAWASHNGQSHNHNDVGNFIVYADGCPIIIDAGVEAYTLKTFGPHRYELWAMQSAYHNLPTVGGVMQKDGREFAARDVEYKKGKSFARLRMDIAGAYPPEAGLGSWVRTVRLNRGEEENISVVDSYELKKARGELTLSLITPCEVTSARPGLLTLKEVRAGRDRQPVHVQMTYDPDKLLARTLEKIPIHSHHEPRFDMRAIWGTDHLTRVVLEARAPGLKNKWELVFTRSQ